ncbi:MAG: hypothetical protein HQK51_21935, partial [Oligoflexia bacterium]|nr:hypothetical protein [Oligoflexia bacterium]
MNYFPSKKEIVAAIQDEINFSLYITNGKPSPYYKREIDFLNNSLERIEHSDDFKSFEEIIVEILKPFDDKIFESNFKELLIG